MDNILKVSQSVNTVAGLKDSLCQYLGLTYTPVNAITLNHKYGVAESEVVSGYPTINCFGIGIKGEYNTDSEQLSEVYSPKAGELDLYTPIPFRCVPVDEDLTASEKSMYRMRELRTINSVQYFLYWLKVIEKNNQVDVTKTTVDGSVLPYEIDTTMLYPTAVKSPSSGGTVNTETIDAKVDCILRVTGSEVLESITVMYNDIRRCKVSEFGIYSGTDKQITGSNGVGGTINYIESLDTKLVNKTCCQAIPLNTPESVEARRVSMGSNKSMVNI